MPSGETANWRLPPLVNIWPSRRVIEKRRTLPGAVCFRFHVMMLAEAVNRIAVSSTGTTRFHRRCRVASRSGSTGPSRGAAATISSSARKSATACHRRFGFFSRQRCSNSRILGFRLGGIKLRSASRTRTDASTSAAVSPVKACRPVSIS